MTIGITGHMCEQEYYSLTSPIIQKQNRHLPFQKEDDSLSVTLGTTFPFVVFHALWSRRSCRRRQGRAVPDRLTPARAGGPRRTGTGGRASSRKSVRLAWLWYAMLPFVNSQPLACRGETQELPRITPNTLCFYRLILHATASPG
jgi:hypothetical protein